MIFFPIEVQKPFSSIQRPQVKSPLVETLFIFLLEQAGKGKAGIGWEKVSENNETGRVSARVEQF